MSSSPHHVFMKKQKNPNFHKFLKLWLFIFYCIETPSCLDGFVATLLIFNASEIWSPPDLNCKVKTANILILLIFNKHALKN